MKLFLSFCLDNWPPFVCKKTEAPVALTGCVAVEPNFAGLLRAVSLFFFFFPSQLSSLECRSVC